MSKKPNTKADFRYIGTAIISLLTDLGFKLLAGKTVGLVEISHCQIILVHWDVYTYINHYRLRKGVFDLKMPSCIYGPRFVQTYSRSFMSNKVCSAKLAVIVL